MKSKMSLTDLPAHLLVDILKSLPDAQSLAAANCSHSTLQYAFCKHDHLIMESVLANQIPKDVLPFALAAYDTRQAPFSFVHATTTLDDLYYNGRPSTTTSLSS